MDNLFTVVGIVLLLSILTLLVIYLRDVRKLISITIEKNEAAGQPTTKDEVFTILISELSKFIPYFLEVHDTLTEEDLDDNEKLSKISEMVYDEFYNYLLDNMDEVKSYEQIVLFLDAFVDKDVLVNSIGKYAVRFINIIIKNKKLAAELDLVKNNELKASIQKITERNATEDDYFLVQQDENV